MPNGDDRDWIRLCAAIDGFRSVHGAWPTRVRARHGFIQGLRDHLFSPDAYARLTSRIELVPDEASIVAEDGSGRSYDYGRQGFPETPPDIAAAHWLEVAPDRGHD